MSEISFNQADIDINNDYIKKIEKKIAELNKRIEKYKDKNKAIKQLR